jgi:hypothetical protein
MQKVATLLVLAALLVGCSSNANLEGPEPSASESSNTQQPRNEVDDPASEELDSEVVEVEEVPFVSTYLESLTELDSCKLQQLGGQGNFDLKGFPFNRNDLPATGTVNVAFVALDFGNAQGDGDVAKRFGNVPSQIENWAEYWSRGNMSYNVQLHPEWIRAPKGAEWYNCPECHGEGKRKQSDAKSLNQIIDAIDPYYDLSDVDFIAVMVPYKAHAVYKFGIYGFRSANTDEGAQTFAVYGGLGIQEDAQSLWDLTVHEILHFQGFVGHGPANGSGYGILMNQWGSSKAITGWEGFLAGWYGENEIACLEANNITEPLLVELGTIDEFGDGYEILIIKLSSEEAIVVEQRTVFGSELTAYRVNVNSPMYRNDMEGVPADERNWWQYLREADGNVAVDNSVNYGGVTITNLGDGRFSVSS